MEITATISYEPITLLLPSTFYSRQWLKLIQGGTSDDTAERTRRLLIKSDKKCRWRNDTSPIRTTLPDGLCSKTRDTFTIRLLFSILSRCLSWRCGYVKNEIVLSSFISSSLILTLVTWIGKKLPYHRGWITCAITFISICIHCYVHQQEQWRRKSRRQCYRESQVGRKIDRKIFNFWKKFLRKIRKEHF